MQELNVLNLHTLMSDTNKCTCMYCNKMFAIIDDLQRYLERCVF